MTNASLTLMQAAVGVFFAISGYHKLVNRERHATLVATLKQDKVPLVSVNAWFVPAVEFMAGMLLALGLHVIPAAVALLVICTVATCVDGVKRIREWKPIDKADAVDDLLYLPEVLLAIMLTVIVVENI